MRATLRPLPRRAGYQPIPIKQDITADEQAFIEAHRTRFRNLRTIDEERASTLAMALPPTDWLCGRGERKDLNNPRLPYYEPAMWWARRAWRRPTISC